MLRIQYIYHYVIRAVSHTRRYSLSIAALWLTVGSAFAAPAADNDSIFGNNGTTSVAPNVPSVLIRNWYTSPDKVPFFSKRNALLQGWSVVAFWSPQYPLSPSKYSKFIPMSMGGGLQKDFGKSSAVRVTGAYTKGEIPVSSADVERYTLSLDYLWNFTNTWFGYDPARSVEMLLVTGGTFGQAKSDGLPSKDIWQGQLGMQVRKTLSPRLSAFIEPYYYVANNDYDYYRNGADYDDGLGVKAGLLVRATGPLRETPWYGDWSNPSWLDNWYIQNLIGLNYGKENGLTALHKIRNYNFNLNVGRWVAPSWGFQVGMVDRQMLFRGNNNRRQTFGRLEGVLNLSSLWDRVSVGRIGVTISGGAELGIERTYASKTGRSWIREDEFYKAVTGAAQLKYFLNGNTAVVGEARVASAGDGKTVMTPSIGMEFYRSHYDRYSFWTKRGKLRHEAMVESGKGGKVFLNRWNWFLDAAVGVDKESNHSRYKPLPESPMAHIGFGVHIDSIHSVRIKERLTYHSFSSTGGKNHFTSTTSLDYMFNLMGFWTGDSPYRRFAMRPFVGAVWVVDNISASPFNKLTITKDFGGVFGVQNSYRLNSNLELYVEPYYTALRDGYNRWSIAAGASYIIERGYQRKALFEQGEPDIPSRFYVQAMGGVQVASRMRFSSSEHKGAFELTLGHILWRNLAFQGTLIQQIATPNMLRQRIQRMYGVRGELVAHALNMFWPDAYDNGWMWTLQGGPEILRNRFNRTHYYGVTGATQLRRRIGHSPVWAAVEARLQFHKSPVGKGTGKEPIWSGMAGLHYELPSVKAWRVGSNGTFGTIDLFRSSLSSTPSPTMLALKGWTVEAHGSWFDAAKYGYGVAVGYDFNHFNAVRVNYDRAWTNMTTSRGDEVFLNAFSADYMLDLTGLLLHPKADPLEPASDKVDLKTATFVSRLSVRPFVGLNLGIHNLPHASRVRDPETREWRYESETDLNLGLQTGLHVNYRINPYLGIVVEQRALLLNNDPYLSPSSHYDWHMLTTAGLKVSF